ncbi:MAG: hypothetical protein V4557_12395 [Bacteroidota bacterium]
MTLEEYGAFNISLINDLPLFIDPFLLFGSDKDEYKEIHKHILDYLTFLKTKSERGNITAAEISSWYSFREVRQNWLGYSISGNGGSGLGDQFGKAMSANMHIVFKDLNNETTTVTSHLEKAGLFQIGVGKDNISDFACNLIKSFLLEYTEDFSKNYLSTLQTKEVMVDKVYFDYRIERWMPKKYLLPFFRGDYILLTPKDILTKDDTWINSHDLRGDFYGICNSIPNSQYRSEINRFYNSKLPAPTLIGKGANQKPKAPTQTEIAKAINDTIQEFPDILDFYINRKEDKKNEAKKTAEEKVKEVEIIFKQNVSKLIEQLVTQTGFYDAANFNAYDEALKRVEFLKDVIENKDGYKLFYYKGLPIKRESDLQVIYRLTWFSSPYDVNREVNNGRGPVDYSISKGARDKSLVEFKLASNSKLKMNLTNQVEIYQKASNTDKSIKVILYFDTPEYLRVRDILKELNLENEKSIVLIDAENNKPSASNVK